MFLMGLVEGWVSSVAFGRDLDEAPNIAGLSGLALYEALGLTLGFSASRDPAALAALESWGNARPSDPRLPELVNGLGVTMASSASPGQLFAALAEFADAVRVNQQPEEGETPTDESFEG